ncbi:MAG: hypothetical protein M1839_004484 [Geoglossum umbratile]|nr:MAG: hypothetical protein M1839_004484 [Geoglossum umbratile]
MLQELIQEDDSSHMPLNSEQLGILSYAARGCENVLAQLDAEFTKIIHGPTYHLQSRGKAKFAWNEERLMKLIAQLESFECSLSITLSFLTAKTQQMGYTAMTTVMSGLVKNQNKMIRIQKHQLRDDPDNESIITVATESSFERVLKHTAVYTGRRPATDMSSAVAVRDQLSLVCEEDVEMELKIDQIRRDFDEIRRQVCLFNHDVGLSARPRSNNLQSKVARLHRIYNSVSSLLSGMESGMRDIGAVELDDTSTNATRPMEIISQEGFMERSAEGSQTCTLISRPQSDTESGKQQSGQSSKLTEELVMVHQSSEALRLYVKKLEEDKAAATAAVRSRIDELGKEKQADSRRIHLLNQRIEVLERERIANEKASGSRSGRTPHNKLHIETLEKRIEIQRDLLKTCNDLLEDLERQNAESLERFRVSNVRVEDLEQQNAVGLERLLTSNLRIKVLEQEREVDKRALQTCNLHIRDLERQNAASVETLGASGPRIEPPKRDKEVGKRAPDTRIPLIGTSEDVNRLERRVLKTSKIPLGSPRRRIKLPSKLPRQTVERVKAAIASADGRLTQGTCLPGFIMTSMVCFGLMFLLCCFSKMVLGIEGKWMGRFLGVLRVVSWNIVVLWIFRAGDALEFW